MSRSLSRLVSVVALFGLLLGLVRVAGASWQPAQRISATLPDDRDVASYQLAPDSSAVVYTADVQYAGRRALYSVPLRGGLGTQLSPAPVVGGVISQYAITPDSQTVVYLGEVASTDKPRTYSIGLNGANATQIDSGLAGSPLALSLAGNTRAVLLVQTAAATRELYSVRLDGIGAPIRLNHQLPAGGSVGQYAVSPDGQWVVFMADGVVDEQVELYSASIDGSVWTALHGPAVPGGDVKEFTISPDGQRVAFTGDLIVDERVDVYSRPIDGSSLPALVYTNSASDASRPLISPDGATVAYVIDNPGDGDQLRFSPILSGDSKRASLLYNGNPHEDIFAFQFSPDSRFLVYITDAATPGSQLTSSKELADDTSMNTLSSVQVLDFKIMPDSSAVVFRRLDKELFISPIDADFVEDELTNLPADRMVEQYEVAPQGDYVLYLADRNADETVELFAVPARMGVAPASQTVKINGIFATYNDVTSFQVSSQGDVVYRADSTIDEKFELYRRINLHEVFLPLNIKG
jgi:hypothetical protein